MRIIKRISAVIIGFVFFIAGLLKLMDPVGSSLIVDSYLNFMHLDFLKFASGLLGTGAALIETLVGAALITGVWRKLSAILTLVMLAGFTLLTIALVIFNPSMDCGCFGEAIHLTHAQSLVKNIVLLALWAIAYIPLNRQEPTRKVKYVSFPIAVISVCLFMLYSQFSLPMMDFTSYKPGAELMQPEDVEFGQENAPILSFSDKDGEYADSLAFDGRVIAVSVYDTGKMNARKWERLSGLVRESAELGYTPLVLVTSTPSIMEGVEGAGEIIPYTYFADRKILMGLNRSNGGASFISDGQMIAKWPVNKLPDSRKLGRLAKADATESLISENNGSRLKMQGFLLYVFAIMLLL